MGKNNRKRSRPTSSAASTGAAGWKSVSVDLPSQTISGKPEAEDGGDQQDQHQDVDNIEMTKEYTSNHYDDPKLSRKANKDLPMEPGEDCGMFFGLEVLDASQYRVEQTGSFKRLIITGEEDVATSADASTEAKPKKSPKQPKNNKETKKISAAADETQNESSETKDSSNAEPKKKKRKKKKKDKTKKVGQDEGETSTKEAPSKKSLEQEPVTPEQLAQIQLSWSRSSGGAHLHDILLESLHRAGFAFPTPIQAATLSASTMGRRNLVGAAPTGSGKTLAFLLPILNSMLQNNDDDAEGDEASPTPKKLQALIMTPTRGK